MITSPILEEKYRVQRKLTEEAGYDVRKYAELCHKIAIDAAEKYGLTLKYGQREGGYLEPLIPRSEGWKREDERGDG
uniref:Uncharacterized protein n=1 Tax=Candidatus Kentrum sp. UNK TaxID=2126344 RepID=A0A451B435_9GAMM|nr:MAG: hypothetical protein BECKUNK1418G_GA0071005_12118 [Candidatus Kentron sp. UNK]VFK73007.1 MAG: hypothetical protein BECKUNK1418H_GA0071006_115612 [Candidatus Kentron sp. UNK]